MRAVVVAEAPPFPHATDRGAEISVVLNRLGFIQHHYRLGSFNEVFFWLALLFKHVKTYCWKMTLENQGWDSIRTFAAFWSIQDVLHN